MRCIETRGDEDMGSSTPYVSSQDAKLLSAYDTVASAYARSINKNSTEWNGKDLRGFIDFLWKTKAHRAHSVKREATCRDVVGVNGTRSAHTQRMANRTKRKGL